MVTRFSDWNWEGVDILEYTDRPGTFESVTRRTLGGDGDTAFQTRYFEVAPGGYTSYERHEHEHNVVVIRGQAKVRLGDDWHEIGAFDVVRVGPNVPHQFVNTGEEPFGMICVVDKVRDRPVLMDTVGADQASK